MATNAQDVKLAAAMELVLSALLCVGTFLGKVGSEEAQDARAKVLAKVENAQKVLQGGQTRCRE